MAAHRGTDQVRHRQEQERLTEALDRVLHVPAAQAHSPRHDGERRRPPLQHVPPSRDPYDPPDPSAHGSVTWRMTPVASARPPREPNRAPRLRGRPRATRSSCRPPPMRFLHGKPSKHSFVNWRAAPYVGSRAEDRSLRVAPRRRHRPRDRGASGTTGRAGRVRSQRFVVPILERNRADQPPKRALSGST
jgi:hypothetical protein